jgi:hypothetical protein
MRRNPAAAIAARLAESETRTNQINFSDRAAPDPLLVTWAGDANYVAHEFVSEGTLKIMIAAQNFDVSVANSSEADAHQRPTGPETWERFLKDGDAISASDSG